MAVLFNGKIVTPVEIIPEGTIYIENGLIKDIVSQKFLHQAELAYDCKGNYVLPGLIDIHCDVVENVIASGKGPLFSMELALTYLDKQLITNGITTMNHSVSIAKYTSVLKNRPIPLTRQYEIGYTINKLKSSLFITNLFHARLELNTPESYEFIRSMLKEGLINEISFMDHSPGAGQYRNIDVFKKELDRYYGFLDEKKKEEFIRKIKGLSKYTHERINDLIQLCHEQNIPVAYHDVDNNEQVLWMKNKGLSICEFPLTSSVALKAKEQGLYNVVGAPNILLDRSHNENVSAIQLLKANLANIICSDYYVYSILPAIKKLTLLEFPIYEAINFATFYPAKALGLTDRGSIELGKRADIIVVDFSKKYPLVTAAFINGQLKYKVL